MAAGKVLGPRRPRYTSILEQAQCQILLQLQARLMANHPLGRAQGVLTHKTKTSLSRVAFQARPTITALVLEIIALANAFQITKLLMIPEHWMVNGTTDPTAPNMARWLMQCKD